jgi:molybdopterin synthase sulfur carrier subunit
VPALRPWGTRDRRATTAFLKWLVMGSGRRGGLTTAAGSGQSRPLHVRVRFFASLREAAGVKETVLELEAGATAEEAWHRLARDFPALAPRRASLAVSLNRRYADTDAALKDGDELVFIPPVSGG